MGVREGEGRMERVKGERKEEEESWMRTRRSAGEKEGGSRELRASPAASDGGRAGSRTKVTTQSRVFPMALFFAAKRGNGAASSFQRRHNIQFEG